MTPQNDDITAQIMAEARARVFTEDLSGCPATPDRYFETAESDPIGVQAVLGATEDGAPLIYVGREVFTPRGLAAFHRHLGELLDVLPGSHGAGPIGSAQPAEGDDVRVTMEAPGRVVVSGRIPGESATVNLRVDVTGDAAHAAGGEDDRWNFAPIAARRLARALREAAVASRHLLAG